MEDNNPAINQFLKSISIIHIAIVFGLVLFTIAIFFTSEDWNFIVNLELFTIIGVTLAFSSLFTSKKIHETFINRAKSQTSIKNKLTGFQIALIIKLALIEGAGLVNVVLGMISKNSFFLVLAVAIAAYLYAQKPTKANIKEALNL